MRVALVPDVEERADVGVVEHRDPSLLRPGLFLYAAPGLRETRFAETVVLLIEHGPQGSMGLVVNRPTEIPLHRALDEVGDLADVRAALAGKDPRGGLRVYSGYAGWTAGQLPDEVRAGVWVLDRADAASIFAPSPVRLWPRVHLILDRLQVRRRPAPGTTPAPWPS
jgi:putative transcriptional regulator